MIRLRGEKMVGICSREWGSLAASPIPMPVGTAFLIPYEDFAGILDVANGAGRNGPDPQSGAAAPGSGLGKQLAGEILDTADVGQQAAVQGDAASQHTDLSGWLQDHGGHLGAVPDAGLPQLGP